MTKSIREKKSYDLVSIGEPLLRFTPPKGIPLEASSNIYLTIAGSQFNVAANLSILGWDTAFLTKIPSGPLGEFVLNSGKTFGVEMSEIKVVEGGKMGITFVEHPVNPRQPQIVYDRSGSAASTITLNDFDWGSILKDVRYAYSDGIFPGLSSSCLEASEIFFKNAKTCECKNVFDINYREHLWAPKKARHAFSNLLKQIDILITNRNVSETVFGYNGEDIDILKHYADEFGCRLICMTYREMNGSSFGKWRATALSDGDFLESNLHKFEVVDRYGTGDAWTAGLLFGLKSGPLNAINTGGALSAMAHTIKGDVTQIKPTQLEEFLKGKTDFGPRR